MLLIDFPPELLKMVLLYSSTPSFVQLIRTCHTFFDLAAQSRDVVKRHLMNVPGDKSVLSKHNMESTRELFLTLRRRAAASLQGVSISADRRDYCFQCASIDAHASCLALTTYSNIALVRKQSSSVQLYDMSQGELKLRSVFTPDPGLDQGVRYQPVHTTFDHLSNLYVLYGTGLGGTTTDPDRSLVHPLAKSGRFSLTHVRWSALSCRHRSWDLGSMVSRIKPSVPVSMAAQGENQVAVAWDNDTRIRNVKYFTVVLFTLYDHGEAHGVVVNKVRKDFWTATHDQNTTSEHWSYPASRISFSSRGKALKYYSNGFATPSCRIQTFQRHSTSNVTVNRIGIDLNNDITEWFFIEDPFFGYHQSVRSFDGADARLCRNVRLSLATVTLASHNQPIACIVISENSTLEDDCSHTVSLDEPHANSLTADTRVVARLWGFKQPTTTMPAVMAYAEQGTRIATACWNKIFVWPLLPRALSERSLIHYQSVHLKTYDKNLKCLLVELKPIVLMAEAVVHKMSFTQNEDELVTITDKGLQIWNLGPSATGRRSREWLSEHEGGAGMQNERHDIRHDDQSSPLYPPVDFRAMSPSVDSVEAEEDLELSSDDLMDTSFA